MRTHGFLHAARGAGMAAVAATACLAAGCGDDAPMDPVDARPMPADAAPGVDAPIPQHLVRGTAVGLLAPRSIRLAHPGGSAVLAIDGDGPFAFDALLASGDTYAVTVEGDSPCVLENGRGTIAGADAELVLACEAAPLLTSVRLSGPAAPVLGVSLARSEYTARVSLFRDAVTVTPVALRPDATITVQGQAVASGMPSAPVALALGDNELVIEVSHPAGPARTYRVTVDRAGPPAQYAYGKASNTGEYGAFGYALALSGDLMAVGAPGESSGATGVNGDQGDDSAEGSGAVYVFRRSGTSWVQEAYLKASNTDPGDRFGSALALSGDTLAVGAYHESSGATGVDGDESDNGTPYTGAVYVFRRTGTSWAQEAYIKASNTRYNNVFGVSVALSGDVLAVGAIGEGSGATGVNGDQSDDSATYSGAVYVFRREGTSWAQEAYIKASNTDLGDRFGHALALSGDVLAVGAPGEDSGATGIDGDQADNGAAESGAVYLFRHTGTGWAQEAYVKASNTDPGDELGSALALSGDLLAVGAPGEGSRATGVNGDQADNGAAKSGAVYLFRHTGTGWAQEAYVKASNTRSETDFGQALALAGDILVVGAPNEQTHTQGIDGQPADGGLFYHSGAVYLLRRIGTSWQPMSFIKASNASPGPNFGLGLAVSGKVMVVGAPYESSGATGMNGQQNDLSKYASGAFYSFQ